MRVLTSHGVAALSFMALACRPAGPAEGGKGSPGYAFVLLEGGEALRAELADTPEERRLGMMFREKVGRDDAMLFRFPGAGFHSIWMKNCRVPLDVVWIREDGRVVHLEENLPPCEPDRACPAYRPLQKARYVLELPGGEIRRRGIRLGGELTIVPPDGPGASD